MDKSDLNLKGVAGKDATTFFAILLVSVYGYEIEGRVP
jgi:hypothetical protein